MKFENVYRHESQKEKGIVPKIQRAGKALAIALLITGGSILTQEGLAAQNNPPPPEGDKKEEVDKSIMDQKILMQSLDSLSTKYPVIIEYSRQYEFGQEIIIHYKDKEGKMESYNLTIPNNTDPLYLTEETIKRLINPEQKFEEINLEKITLAPEVKAYFEKNNIQLKGNEMIFGGVKMFMVDVKDVQFQTDGKILTITVINNDGSTEIHHLEGDYVID